MIGLRERGVSVPICASVLLHFPEPYSSESPGKTLLKGFQGLSGDQACGEQGRTSVWAILARDSPPTLGVKRDSPARRSFVAPGPKAANKEKTSCVILDDD